RRRRRPNALHERPFVVCYFLDRFGHHVCRFIARSLFHAYTCGGPLRHGRCRSRLSHLYVLCHLIGTTAERIGAEQIEKSNSASAIPATSKRCGTESCTRPPS